MNETKPGRPAPSLLPIELGRHWRLADFQFGRILSASRAARIGQILHTLAC